MSKIKDGGPAFSHLGLYQGVDGDLHPTPTQHGGMTLRDWFAGQALAGMLAHSTRYKPRPGAPANWHEAISEESYELADAMLAERDKAEGGE